LTVTADASRSTDASGIASYVFDFGDGAIIRPMPGASASHKYCRGGIYRLTVIVTNTVGLSSSAFLYVAVTQPVNPVPC
jgi:PKD repeat protein